MCTGFIKLYRKSMEDPLFFSDTFSKWQAWCDLILLAKFKDGEMVVRGIRFAVKRGCVYVASRELAERWKWSRGKVLRFLSDLEREHKIVPQTIPQIKNVIACISIVNYDYYQNDDTTNDTTDSTTKQEKRKEPKEIKKQERRNIKESVSNDTPKKEGELFEEQYSFDDFWDSYGYKKSKKDAVKAWNKLSDNDKRDAISAIPAYKEDCKIHNRNMQHPATYLNGRTWEDEFDTRVFDVSKLKGDDKLFFSWAKSRYPRLYDMQKPLTRMEFQNLRDLGYSDETLFAKMRYANNRADLGKYISTYELLKEWLQ